MIYSTFIGFGIVSPLSGFGQTERTRSEICAEHFTLRALTDLYVQLQRALLARGKVICIFWVSHE